MVNTNDNVSLVNRSPGIAAPGIINLANGPINAHTIMNANPHKASARKPPAKPSRCQRIVKAYKNATK